MYRRANLFKIDDMDNTTNKLPPSLPVRLQFAADKSPVTYTLLGINVVIYLAQLGSLYLLGFDLPAELGLKVNELIAQGQLWRLFTPMFLHGSIIHIGFNMYALYVIGRGLERTYGHGRFLTLYILSGFAGNVVSMLFSPNPSLGSSTAIFGLLAAEGIFFFQNRKFYGDTAQKALVNIVSIALVNFIIGLSPGIDNWGHLGGFLGGLIFAWLGGPLLQVTPVYEEIPPYLRLADARQFQQVILAVLVVVLMFTIAAAGGIYIR